MKEILIYLFGAFLLWFSTHITIITIDGLNDKIGTSELAVVLGNKVELDGEPSKRLKSRLDRAVDLYKKEHFKYVLVSGGTGKEGVDEAVVMKHYLIEKGIPEKKVWLDRKGNNSLLTAKNTKIIMNDLNLNSVTIISQFYHISRVKLAFRKVGIKSIYAAHAKFFEVRDIYSLSREFFAYYKYLLI